MTRKQGDESFLAASARLQRASGTALRSIAVDALALGTGETLPKGDVYRERLKVGAGTVQQAFQILSSAEALHTQSRGHLGRLITDVSAGRLWQLAGLEAVRIALPPRGPIEVRAFAEYTSEALGHLGIPYAIDHRRGAGERIRAVRAGEVDIAVVSSGVAGALNTDHGDELIAVQKEPGTYYAPERVLVLGSEGRRIAVDSSSLDQLRLTESEFPREEGFEYIEVDFPRVPVEILRGVVDRGVWHEMQTLISPALAGIDVGQPERPRTREIVQHSSNATMLITPVRSELKVVVDALRSGDLEGRRRHLMSMGPEDPALLDSAWTV